MLASMRLCANVPGQYAIQTALGGYQSINDLIAPGGRLCRQRDLAYDLLTRDSRRQLRQAEGGAVHVPAARPEDLSDRRRPAVHPRPAARRDACCWCRAPASTGRRPITSASCSCRNVGRPAPRRSAASRASSTAIGNARYADSTSRHWSLAAMKPIKVGLLGIGTVGSGTFTVLRAIRRRSRAAPAAASRSRASPTRPRTAQQRRRRQRARSTRRRLRAVVDDPRGRHRRRADRRLRHRRASWCSRRSTNGKHVVTANKALLAVHGTEIFAARATKGVMVAFEAAVAGGIPIIKALREGLTANRIEWIAGIINGTTNFILSEMRDKGLDFADVLKEAQRLGYAEADPTFDIEGIDAAHKADDHERDRVRHPGAVRQGLRRRHQQARSRSTSSYAEQLGYRIKLLGITKRRTRRHRVARASDADSGQAPDRQRRRRDERRARAGRRGRHDALLRQGRGRRADRHRR